MPTPAIQGLTLEHLAAISEWAAKLPFIEAIYVFGSRAKQRAKHQSDLDMAIVVPFQTHSSGAILFRPLDDEEKAELKNSLALPFGIDFQVTHPKMGDRIVWPAVVDHGIEIYRAHHDT